MSNEPVPTSTGLAEVNPKSLAQLMAESPLTWSNSDVERIVTELRQARSKWAQADAEAKASGRKNARASKALSSPAPKADVSLEDLGL